MWYICILICCYIIMSNREKASRTLHSIPLWLPTLITVALILALTLLPVPKQAEEMALFPHADKVVHFLMFGFLSAVVWWDLSRHNLMLSAPLRYFWPAVVLSAALGGIVELLQGAMHNGRGADWADFAADAAGALLLPLILWRVINACLRMRPQVWLAPVSAKKVPHDKLNRIYHEAFPPEERREWTDIVKRSASADSPMQFFTVMYRGRKAGLITCWRFKEFDYVEHFAVDPSLRGRGVGAAAIEALAAMSAARGVPVVLEVELPETGRDARRRIAFYERCGFKAHADFKYIQPPYGPGLPEVELMLMTCGPSTDLDRVAAVLHSEVYGK